MGGGASLAVARRAQLSAQQSTQLISSLPTPQKLYEDLQIDYFLGEGGYSQVYHGVSAANPQQQLAIKIVNLRKFFSPNRGLSKSDMASLKTVLNELKVFQAIETVPFTVVLISAFRYSMKCYFVMECFSGGDLRNLLRRHGPLNESTVAYLVGCIGSALHHIHKRGVIHRDIKPENIGIDYLGRPCLADFGISMVASAGNPVPLNTSSSGTLFYLAPEVLGPGNCHSYQADYWSLGIMTYELLFKNRPFSRHCPFPNIEFVANEYGWMWFDLLHRSRHPFSSSSVFNSGRGPLDQEKLSHFMNFENISRPIDWVKPFPDCHLRLSNDGYPPPCLITVHENQSVGSTRPPLPCSDEMRELLNGLLDVRIPLRLGSFSRYCAEFEGHACFKKYGYDISCLPTMPSPLCNPSFHFSQPETHFSSSNSCYAFDNGVEDDKYVERMLQSLAPGLRGLLLHFYYHKTPCSASATSLLPQDRLGLPTAHATLETGASISTSV
jgi:serine/threonine protein kinase